MLAWLDVYSTGFPDIDVQHKKLFQVVNKLEEDIELKVGEETISKVLDFLEKYAKVHFGYEEECMHKYRCQVAEKNQSAHQQFIENYKSYRGRYGQGEDKWELLKDIQSETERWLINHICKIDVHLKECIHRRAKEDKI